MTNRPNRTLHLIADPVTILDAEGFARVLAAMRSGLDVVQVRGPNASATARTVLDAVQRLRPHTEETGVSLFVNDRIDVALAVNAEGGKPVGVHLGGRSLPVAAVLRAFPRLSVSLSVHSVEEGIAAARDGTGVLTLGHIFATPSHPGEEPIGLAPLRDLVQAVDIPVVAIGGIEATNAGVVLETGATGIAVISAILRAADPARATADLRAILDMPTIACAPDP